VAGRATWIVVAAAAACSSTQAARGPAPAPAAGQPDDPVAFLITSAAADFHAHMSPPPVRFREVHVGSVSKADGTPQYRLCGEYLPAEGAQWIPFATIKTSGYEQYLGGGSSNYCQNLSHLPNDPGDLSSALQREFDTKR
jgi:hypothetical protein